MYYITFFILNEIIFTVVGDSTVDPSGHLDYSYIYMLISMG